ncbi:MULTISPECIES: putative holin-like toxin [Lactiplantibacillus]|nr:MULTISPECIES: putative holin-like toxin [Lactiplantibacillus]MDO1604263.1 putative holin-like toxin [Lactiplantibacillus plantarum]MEE4616860.1 putative holin-like toxin [Lactiplantibacillus plantarum]
MSVYEALTVLFMAGTFLVSLLSYIDNHQK